MGQKCALIVDDSRTAREILSRMLATHGLRVEMAESAEQALEFLGHHRPDVIFMDHMMPGMDGFQAVKAIKENPATATIPVMMYTSQSGELYVGQARALGAVGVLPKQIKPVEVAEVLTSLRIIPPAVPVPARRSTDHPQGLPGVEAALQPADWSDLHRWLQQMLADHNQALRSDLESSMARVMAEQLAAHGRGPASGMTGGRIPFWPAGALILVLATVAAVFFGLHLDSQTRWQETARRNQELMAVLEQERQWQAELPPPAPAAAPAGASLADSVAALEWSLNRAASYPPEELPFGDGRLQVLTDLVQRLNTLGFAGLVRLESHVGDFCMERDGESGWRLAPDDVPVEACHRMGLSPEEARAVGARQSLAFANYLAQLTAAGGAIRLQLDSLGNSRPVAAYPPVLPGTTAGEWNAAARINQRVEVRLIPDPAVAAAAGF